MVRKVPMAPVVPIGFHAPPPKTRILGQYDAGRLFVHTNSLPLSVSLSFPAFLLMFRAAYGVDGLPGIVFEAQAQACCSL